jgi:hypothetical protein
MLAYPLGSLVWLALQADSDLVINWVQSRLNESAQADSWVKVLGFFVVWIGLWLPVAIPLAIKLQWRPPKPLSMAQKLPLVASLYVIAPLVLWVAAKVENVPFSSYGLNWHGSLFRSLGLGIGLAILGLAVVFSIETALGWVSWQRDQLPALLSAVVTSLALGLWIGITEELIFRGFLQNQLQQEWPMWLAAIVASLIFAVLHLVWDGPVALPQLPGLWLMGLVLVLARWVDGGSLGLAWGLHAGWVWGIASLDTAKLIAYTGRSSAWVTGIGGSPLAGVFGVLLMLATGVFLWGWQAIAG